MNTRTTSEQSSLCSVFLCRKTSARFLAPPLSQKVTLGSPVRLQAHSRRLSVAANLLRVFALRRKNFPFGTSYACSDFFISKNLPQAPLFLLFAKRHAVATTFLRICAFCAFWWDQSYDSFLVMTSVSELAADDMSAV